VDSAVAAEGGKNIQKAKDGGIGEEMKEYMCWCWSGLNKRLDRFGLAFVVE
jgi:hypothetical protein